MVQAAEVVEVDGYEVVVDVHEEVKVVAGKSDLVVEGNTGSQDYWRRPCQAQLVDV